MLSVLNMPAFVFIYNLKYRAFALNNRAVIFNMTSTTLEEIMSILYYDKRNGILSNLRR